MAFRFFLRLRLSADGAVEVRFRVSQSKDGEPHRRRFCGDLELGSTWGWQKHLLGFTMKHNLEHEMIPTDQLWWFSIFLGPLQDAKFGTLGPGLFGQEKLRRALREQQGGHFLYGQRHSDGLLVVDGKVFTNFTGVQATKPTVATSIGTSCQV